ncbi:holo-ACP synthase [Conchiformibius steedae DSM 2580]|uniref:Holo-[acyl-carrier-protein] synthase n=2 Tax=Conchiformibius steedae TaxID=153493 RepID=A0A3P2A9S5_9NEIS|nr:holo-ACP synthase [Conchiformibius steedae]QMT32782.1 holo-ACP synthase [Conchiformibius steedae]RRD91725.1 holo-ACP synthase [Conchiformibius steedae]URD67393.1 holo-ACP synthase [Conchiformibius steedae DSM 2580]
MIYGIGTDILAVKRIETLYKKYGEALPRRILSRIEALEFADKFSPKNRDEAVRFLAKRFAAKEAFAKAVGTGIREPVGFHGISVSHNEAGKPEFVCEEALKQWLVAKNIVKIHLSLSDEARYVSAFAVAETA